MADDHAITDERDEKSAAGGARSTHRTSESNHELWHSLLAIMVLLLGVEAWTRQGWNARLPEILTTTLGIVGVVYVFALRRKEDLRLILFFAGLVPLALLTTAALACYLAARLFGWP